MSDRPTVGFIGVGLMGHGMASNILKAGYPLVIKGNRNRQPVDDLVGQGATEVQTAREVAERCDIVHLCLSNSPQVEDVFRGEDGLLSANKSGLIVIDTTTADPTSTVVLADELTAAGGHFVDAPLGRTPKEAAEGKLDAMVGADEAVLEKVRPVIDTWAGTVTHMGPVGNGHRMKLLMNFLSMSYAALYSEAAVMAAKSGISPAQLRTVIAGSRMGCGFFDTFMNYVVDRNRDAHKFAIANGAKDLRYVSAMAQDAGVVTAMTNAARLYFTHAEAIGASQDYVPMLSDHVARLSGIDLADYAEKT